MQKALTHDEMVARYEARKAAARAKMELIDQHIEVWEEDIVKAKRLHDVWTRNNMIRQAHNAIVALQERAAAAQREFDNACKDLRFVQMNKA